MLSGADLDGSDSPIYIGTLDAKDLSSRMTTMTTLPLEPNLPITKGSLADFPNSPIACMRRLHAEHGDVAALEEAGLRIAFVFSPDLNKQVLSDAKTFYSRFFALRGGRKSCQRRVSSGLLSMNGQKHRGQRRMLMEPFQKRVIGHYHETVQDFTREMLATWTPGETRDLHQEMNQFMLRVTSGILFGVDMPELANRIGKLTDEWVHMNHELGIGAFVSDASITEKYHLLEEKAAVLEQEIQTLIDHRRNGNVGRDVLSLLMQAYGDEQSISNNEFIGHVALLFGAAHLTTAHTMTWALFLLSQHPEIATELLNELDAEIASDSPTLDEVGRLSTLERVVKESMRVLPASSYSQRYATDFVNLGGLKLNPGTPVVFSQFMTHHRADLYANPEHFQPERWQSLKPSPYEYLPFGAGPRMCVGAPLAMQIIKTVLPTVVKKFCLTVQPHATVDAEVVSTMLGPLSTIPVRIDDQNGQFAASPINGNIHSYVTLPHSQPVATGLRDAA